MSLILDKSELERLTGYRRPSRQVTWLRDHGYEFFVRRGGHPNVLRDMPMRQVQGKIDGCGLLSREEIIRRSTPFPRTKICGVYFLIQGATIIYVGKSRHVARRILEHIAAGDKRFDSYYYLRVKPADLSRLEQEYITALRPGMNTQGRPKQWGRQ